MAAAAIQMKGTTAVSRRIFAARRAGVVGMMAGVDRLNGQTAARAQGYAPVESGALRDSIQPVPATADARRVEGTVVAGDAATADYAVRQHEDLTLNHPNGGGAKFLERAMMDFAGATGNAIVGATARARVEAV